MGVYANGSLAATKLGAEFIDRLAVGDELEGLGGLNRIVNIEKFPSISGKYCLLNGADVAIGLDQPVLTIDGWAAFDVEAARKLYDFALIPLRLGDILITRNGTVPLDTIELKNNLHNFDLFFLQLDGDHTFFVGDFCLHNKGGSSNATSSTKVEFADEQKPYIQEIFSEGQKAFDAVRGVKRDAAGNIISSTPPEYTGRFLADPKKEGLGLNLAERSARSLAEENPGWQISSKAMESFLPAFKSVGESFNPEVYQAAVRPFEEKLTRETLPMLASSAIEKGAYGGSKAQELERYALDDFTQNVADTIAKIQFEDLQNRRGVGLQAASILPSLATSDFTNNILAAQTLEKVGEARTARDQAAIDEELKQFQNLLEGPYAGLANYQDIIQGGGTLSSQSTTSGSGAGGIGGALQGGLGGLALGSSLASLPIFTGVGAAGPALAPLAGLGGPLTAGLALGGLALGAL